MKCKYCKVNYKKSDWTLEPHCCFSCKSIRNGILGNIRLLAYPDRSGKASRQFWGEKLTQFLNTLN